MSSTISQLQFEPNYKQISLILSIIWQKVYPYPKYLFSVLVTFEYNDNILLIFIETIKKRLVTFFISEYYQLVQNELLQQINNK